MSNTYKSRFGHDVLGPILAEFSLRLWIHTTALKGKDDTSILFCARGGLRIQAIYEAFLKATGLTSPVPMAPVMVSRLVAARPGFLSGSRVVFQHIKRELGDASNLDVAEFLSTLTFPELRQNPAWNAPFSERELNGLLATEQYGNLFKEIRNQSNLFKKHLEQITFGRKRILLCDTGLFGSTHEMLAEGLPEWDWSSVLIARANYKNFPTPHFSRMAGLSLEADHYAPWRNRTALLRHWHLIESVLEPSLPSVKRFDVCDGKVRSNMEISDWKSRVLPEEGSVFSGVMAYIDALGKDAALRIPAAAAPAWRKLHRIIVLPSRKEAEQLDTGERSTDFGTSNTVPTIKRTRGLMAIFKDRSLWREGEVAISFGIPRLPTQIGLELAYATRLAKLAFSKRIRKHSAATRG